MNLTEKEKKEFWLKSLGNNLLFKIVKNKLVCGLFFFQVTSVYADISTSQATALLIQPVNQEENLKNIVSTNKDKLITEYANYETYRPDSFSDATRNPFGPKRYKKEDLAN